MKLTDAMAKGHQEMEWTTEVLEEIHGPDREHRAGCALGLAAVGLGARSGSGARSMVFNGKMINLSEGYQEGAQKIWCDIVRTNNACSSYEEVVLALKEAGLDQVEVELPDRAR